MDKPADDLPEVAPSYGERIEILGETRSNSLGRFEVMDSNGALSEVEITERDLLTSEPSIGALSYSFRRISSGEIRRKPRLWLIASRVLPPVVLTIALLTLFNEELSESPLRIALYVLFGLMLVTHFVGREKIKSYDSKHLDFLVLNGLQKLYGDRVIFDSPAGAIREAKATVATTLGLTDSGKLAAKGKGNV